MEIELGDIEKVLESDKNILAAYLYGSCARGDNLRESDIDIAVLLKDMSSAKDPFYESILSIRLQEILGGEVEVRILNDKSPMFIYQVLKYGRPIFSRNDRLRVDFETNTLCKYFDFLPLMQRYNHARYARYGIG